MPARIRRARRGDPRRNQASALDRAAAALLAALLIAAAVASLGAISQRPGAAAPAGSRSQSRPTVTVGPGDTLWDIASRHAPQDLDLRYAVHLLRECNCLDSAALRVGQRLRLPSSWAAR